MKVVEEKVKEVVVGKNEAGLFEYKDAAGSVEMGDIAFVVKNENVFTGTIDNVYFKKRENAEKHN